MNRVLRIIVLGVVLAAVAFGQVEPRTRAERRAAAPAASMSPGDSSSPAPRHLYEHHTNFYEFVLHQLNPNDKDWGAWYEERRAALIDAALHDPCFWYCLGLTLAASVPSQRCSNPSPIRIARTTSWRSGWMRCVGLRPSPTRWPLKPSTSTTPTSSFAIGLLRRKRGAQRLPWPEVRKIAQPQANPTKAREETELQKRDKTRMESEASHTATTTPDRSNGGASPSNKGGSNGQGKEPPNPLTPSYADLVRQINILQQQLIAEQDKNKRLKGGA